MSLVGSNNEEKIWNYLKGKGLNDYGIAGLIGNMYAESGLNPDNLENAYERKLGFTDKTYTDAVDNGAYSNFVNDAAGYGLCQFTYYTLKQALLDYARSSGVSIGDLEMQLAFTCMILARDYASVWSTLQNAKSVLEASNAVLLKFERPADQSTSAQSRRASYGQQFFDKYANKNTTGKVTSKMGMTGAEFVAPLEAFAGENEAVLGSNNTSVNKFWNAKGQPYCGYSLWMCAKKTGSKVFSQCSNPAYVPTFKTGLSKTCVKVSGSQAQEGDMWAYKDQHVGAVKKRLSGNTVITIEGNSTVYKTIAEAERSTAGTGAYEGIGYKKRVLDGNYTVYHYDFSKDNGSTYAGGDTPSGGSTGGSVISQFQSWLNNNFSAGIAVDGEYGPATKKAAVRALQRTLNNLYKCGLVVDGGYGPLTEAAIAPHPVKVGAKNALVYILQGMLAVKGVDPGDFDGDFGGNTKNAVIAYQKKLFPNTSSEWDGEAGSKTFNGLFDYA